MSKQAETQPSQNTLIEPSKYQLRLESTRNITGYNNLSDDSKQLIAHLAFDPDLGIDDYNHVVVAELGSVRLDTKVRPAVAHAALDSTVTNPELNRDLNLPGSFEEARTTGSHTYEDFLARSDYSENDPDDVAFYSSDALSHHMERLHNLSDKYRKYARGNASVEKKLASRNDGGLWVEHHSLALVRENNTQDNAAARIYMNPKLQDSFDIYQEIFLEANRQGLRFQSKILDPSWYGTKGINETALDSRSDAQYQRRDPIVFYGFKESEDQLLAIVEGVYKKHLSSFIGRETGAVPMPLAPGLAAGDHVTSKDDTGMKESLTTHRGNVFDKMPKDLSFEERRKYLLDNHINPNNIAFNT